MMKYGCNLKTMYWMSKLFKNINLALKNTSHHKVEWLTVRGPLSDFIHLRTLINKPSSTTMYHVQLMKSESKLLTVIQISHMVHCDVMSSYVLKVLIFRTWFLVTLTYISSSISNKLLRISRVLRTFSLHWNQPKIK